MQDSITPSKAAPKTLSCSTCGLSCCESKANTGFSFGKDKKGRSFFGYCQGGTEESISVPLVCDTDQDLLEEYKNRTMIYFVDGDFDRYFGLEASFKRQVKFQKHKLAIYTLKSMLAIEQELGKEKIEAERRKRWERGIEERIKKLESRKRFLFF